MNLTRRTLNGLAAAAFSLAMVGVHAQEAKAPDALIKEVSVDVLEAVKSDKSIRAGNVDRVNALVDEKVMPHVDFGRMTASAVGRYWREATPEQKKRLEAEFKQLLIRTYAGALAQVSDEQKVEIKPMRAPAGDANVVVKSEIRGKGDPIQLDYRLEKSGDAWKIYDVSVLGVWLGQNYRNSFAQEIGANGIDSLINKLAEKNKSAASKG